ncbi:alanine--glyoxylate aminotransferase family protein, partial [Candidatus Woesearchaeota archaeon]|nr:alanine--glyoxylate aminotransferase family protein [Candidatus Woesearchaeota archaeon]
KKNYDENMTPYTPSVSHLIALNNQLDYILKEGLENRFSRHKGMAKMAREWAKNHGFELFSEKGYESDTITCVTNTPGLDLAKVKEEMGKRGYLFDAGYRKLNEKLAEKKQPNTFRLVHMGDIQEDELKEFLDNLEEAMNL